MSTENTLEMVKHVAKLSRLALTPEEETRFAGDMQKILKLVDQLSEVSLEGDTEVLSQQQALLREDINKPFADEHAKLMNAPLAEGTAFRVPKILDN